MFWKSKYKRAGIILKSGKEIIVVCKSFNWKIDNNEIISYTIAGIKGSNPSYIRISEIVAIVTYA